MKTGTNLDELMSYLKDLDDNTSIDSLLTNGEKEKITLYRGKRGIKWDSVETVSNNEVFTKGRSINDFMQNLEKIQENKELNYFDVLCLKESKPVKTWDGNIICDFFLIDPFSPYEVDSENRIIIPVLSGKEFSQSEYKILMETRIAFLDVDTEAIYPIRDVAKHAVAQYMDAQEALNRISTVPLSSALLLAERLSEQVSLNLICRNVNEKFKPIIGVSAGKTVQESQYSFYKKVFNEVSQKGIYNLMNWKISADRTVCEVEPYLNVIYSPRIEIISSDLIGISMAINGYAKIGKGYVNIFHQTCRRGVDINLSEVFNNLYSAFIKYDAVLNKTVKYCINPEDLTGIKKCLGKKRSRKHNVFNTSSAIAGEDSVYEISKMIVNGTYEMLPNKQSDELSKAYYDFINNL